MKNISNSFSTKEKLFGISHSKLFQKPEVADHFAYEIVRNHVIFGVPGLGEKYLALRGNPLTEKDIDMLSLDTFIFNLSKGNISNVEIQQRSGLRLAKNKIEEAVFKPF